jgi:hypothetical protein
MTGSVGDAEDIVQDAFLGLTRARLAGTTIAYPKKAYLTTAVTRLGINYLHSARVRRETYVGDWLPEPVVVPAGEPGPAGHAESWPTRCPGRAAARPVGVLRAEHAPGRSGWAAIPRPAAPACKNSPGPATGTASGADRGDGIGHMVQLHGIPELDYK